MRSIYNIDDTTKNVENIVTSTINNTTLNGDIIGNIKSNQISAGVITDSDIAANAVISDSKLNQITTANKVTNSATTATSANTANAIVARNASGDVTLSTLHGNIDNSTLNVGTTDATTINIGTATTTQLVNIGTGSGITTINLGGAGDTVNIAGTLAYINTTNLNVTDSNIVLNKGGSAGSGGASGISIEEAGTNTGYVQVNGTRGGWALKAPSTAGIATITPGASGIALNQSSHNPVTFNTPANGFYIDPATQIVTMGTSSAISTGSLTNADWSTFNTAATTVSNATPAVTASTLVSRDGSANSAFNSVYANTLVSTPSITTPGSNDLVLNPAGNNINCSGKSLYNINGLTSSTVTTSTIYTSGANDLTLNPGGNDINCSAKYVYNIGDLSVTNSIVCNNTQASALFTPSLSTFGSSITCNSKTLDSLTLTNATATASSNNISAKSLLTNNGSIDLYSNASPTVALQTLVAASTTAAKWDYPSPWMYFDRYSPSSPTVGTTITNLKAQYPSLPTLGSYFIEVRVLYFTNSTSSTNTIQIDQNGSAISSYTWNNTNYTLEPSWRFLYTFTSTSGLTLRAKTSSGTVTFNVIDFMLIKVNGNP